MHFLARACSFWNMLYNVRKKNETSDKLMRRFKRSVQKSGLVKKARAGVYFSQKKTKRRIRAEAIARTAYREKRAKERLLG